MSHEDQPLGDAFYDNPLEYMQNHVRNLNNEMFLSEYHINSLYALLLVGRNSPWDMVKGNSPRIKEEIDFVLGQKVADVKSILENLSIMYEDKSKKSAITHIEKLMCILKSRNKSIYIEKDRSSDSFKRLQALSQMTQNLQNRETVPPGAVQVVQLKNQAEEGASAQENQSAVIIKEYEQPQNNRQNIKVQHVVKSQECQHNNNPIVGQKVEVNQNREQKGEKSQQEQEKYVCKYCPPQKGSIETKEHHESHRHRQIPNLGNGKQVFSIFYGLSNISNLTAMALTNMVEFNSVDRFLKFKLSESYIMTIKSEDPFSFDTNSQLSALPPQMFVHHIFPYLTASELFSMRAVCRQWLQNVKQSWHATFKRQMFVQLLACQFCKDIEFYYKTIQLRNPFFQKISLLIHALIEIINWDSVSELISSNTTSLQLKRVFMILLRLIGEDLPLTNLSSITDAFFMEHRQRLDGLKAKISGFFSSLSGSDLSINDLRLLKTNFLDDAFMRIQDMSADDKTPMLLSLLAKQINLQQILRNHIYLAQQYLLNTKKRLDNISKKMVYHKGYLEGVYKILLLKSTEPLSADNVSEELPNFNEMLQSIFTNSSLDKPDFVLKGKEGATSIYLDKATKLDIIFSTVYNNNDQPETQEKGQKVQEKVEVDVGIGTEGGEVRREEKRLRNEIVSEINVKVDVAQEQRVVKQQTSSKGLQTQPDIKSKQNP